MRLNTAWKGGLGFTLTLQRLSFALTQCLLKPQTVIVADVDQWLKEFRRVLLVQKMELHMDNGRLSVQSSYCLKLLFCLLLCQNVIHDTIMYHDMVSL